LEAKPTVRTFLLGGFGFGKTTSVARSLLRNDVQVLYVPGSSLTQEVTTSKIFLSRCLNADSLFAGCAPEDREIYERMLRAAADHLFKDASLPLALVIDGLDESPFLCRSAGLLHLLNNLETVRIPLVLAMRSEYWLSRVGDLRSTSGKLAAQGEPRVRQIRKLELLPWRYEEILLFVQRFRSALADPAEQERLGALEDLVTQGRFAEIYGDIPQRPLFLRLIAESVAALGLPGKRVGRAALFRDWALWKIRRDLRVARPHLVFADEPTEEVLETAWEAMLWAAASMAYQETVGVLDLLPDCSFDRVSSATPRLAKMEDVIALSLQSLLILSRERTGDRPSRVAFAHRAFQEFFLAWFLAEGGLDREWVLPASVQEWIHDLRRERLLDPASRREAERPPGLPPAPMRPLQWMPRETASSQSQRTAPPAELTLYVLERPGGQRRLFDLRLTAHDPELDLRERSFGIIELGTDPAEFFRQQLKEDFSAGVLRARGAFFAEQLLPADLRKTLSSLRGRIQTLQIVSDDPWIPWEILRIEESPESEVVDGPFLCEAFALTRWMPSIRETRYLPLSRIAVVAPRSSKLPHAEREWQDLQALTGDGRQVERIPARLREIGEAFCQGIYDGWHFTGHGLFRGHAPDLSPIWLEEKEALTPVHLAGEAKRMGLKRPLVFLNACETGQSGLSLTDAGGWVPHFLRTGAGAFLGTLWPIRDSRSREFARTFYAGFIGGLPLAEAVQAARRTIRSEEDPTWLAYTVFGHPQAVCRPVPEQISSSA
jgi:CHAT domain